MCRNSIKGKNGRGYLKIDIKRMRTIHRKEGILKRIGGEEYVDAWEHGTPGRLSKGKIHCSCPMCREKSYDNPSIPDLRKQEAFQEQMKEL